MPPVWRLESSGEDCYFSLYGRFYLAGLFLHLLAHSTRCARINKVSCNFNWERDDYQEVVQNNDLDTEIDESLYYSTECDYYGYSNNALQQHIPLL